MPRTDRIAKQFDSEGGNSQKILRTTLKPQILKSLQKKAYWDIYVIYWQFWPPTTGCAASCVHHTCSCNRNHSVLVLDCSCSPQNNKHCGTEERHSSLIHFGDRNEVKVHIITVTILCKITLEELHPCVENVFWVTVVTDTWSFCSRTMQMVVIDDGGLSCDCGVVMAWWPN